MNHRYLCYDTLSWHVFLGCQRHLLITIESYTFLLLLSPFIRSSGPNRDHFLNSFWISTFARNTVKQFFLHISFLQQYLVYFHRFIIHFYIFFIVVIKQFFYKTLFYWFHKNLTCHVTLCCYLHTLFLLCWKITFCIIKCNVNHEARYDKSNIRHSSRRLYFREFSKCSFMTEKCWRLWILFSF